MARGAQVAVAWFTQAREAPRVQVGWSVDGGQSFAAPVTLQRGATLGRVDLVPWGADLSSLLVSHVTRVGRQYHLLLTTVVEGAAGVSARVATLSGTRADGFPRLALVGGVAQEALVAWTTRGPDATGVAGALVRLPAAARQDR